MYLSLTEKSKIYLYSILALHHRCGRKIDGFVLMHYRWDAVGRLSGYAMCFYCWSSIINVNETSHKIFYLGKGAIIFMLKTGH